MRMDTEAQLTSGSARGRERYRRNRFRKRKDRKRRDAQTEGGSRGNKSLVKVVCISWMLYLMK